MSALLFDLGNSRWKLARADGDDIGSVVYGAYGDDAALRSAVMRESGGVSAIWLASVVDRLTTMRTIAMLEEMFPMSVQTVKSTDPMPNVVSGYHHPEQLGIDRLLAMVAARAATLQPLCVVDAGTAATIDFVDTEGQHLGGFIMPGTKMFRDCLLANTSIPRDERVEDGAIVGRDTPTAVALGGLYAVAATVEHFIRGDTSLFTGQTAHVFVGGGDAERFLDLLPQPCTKLDHLVLRGLAVVAADGDS